MSIAAMVTHAPVIGAPFRALARAFVFLFFKIKEPRTVRLFQLVIYLCMIVAGHFVIATPPEIYTTILGPALVVGFGVAIFIGGIFGTIAVLPGIWWLERIALVSLWVGLGTFVLVQIALAISIVGLSFAVALAFALAQRWADVTEFDYAPRAS